MACNPSMRTAVSPLATYSEVPDRPGGRSCRSSGGRAARSATCELRPR
jgi:hypothetical protein